MDQRVMNPIGMVICPKYRKKFQGASPIVPSIIVVDRYLKDLAPDPWLTWNDIGQVMFYGENWCRSEFTMCPIKIRLIRCEDYGS
jgi:hypothetical protein